MINIDEILFSKESKNSSSSLFYTDVNFDTDTAFIDISYFEIKKEKKLSDDDIVKLGQRVIGVGFCREKNIINLCVFDENPKIYFWTSIEDVEFKETVKENWNLEDIKIHYKAVNEKWTIRKPIKKELKKNKNSLK
jgi:hypothetical protein